MNIGSTYKMARWIQVLIVLVMILFAVFYLTPLYVMVVNSVKHLSEIRQGNMMSFPEEFTLEYWKEAWSTTQIGVNATGLKPYFINSIKMVVPSVFISTLLGALAGFVLSKWNIKHARILVGLILFGAFIPFQIVLIPMARTLGWLGIPGTTAGLILVHVIYGVSFTTLFFYNAYVTLPNELVQSAQVDGAHFYQIFWKIILPNSAAVIMVTVIWQTTNIWNDFLFGASFGGSTSQPMQVAVNNLVSSSTGVKEYNVHFAGALMAAFPTLAIYLISGRYFVRGLMSGSVKG
jgi:glucose/mannose transport system permease protein